MSKPKALDLFCGAGGATKGLQRAGFAVHGIDIKSQPDYCGEQFTEGDALTFPTYEWLRQFDFIWASPPCQAHTSMRVMHNAREHEDLIPATRALLRSSRLPYVIENVVGAPLIDPFVLCGTMFGLGVEVYDGWRQLRRHRLFESSVKVGPRPSCQHQGATIGIYGDHARDRRRKPGVRDRGTDFPDVQRVALARVALARVALGIDWMNWKGLSQSIPPAYSEFIGRQVLAH